MDPEDVVAAVTAEVKRIGNDARQWNTRLAAVENAVKNVEAIDGMHDRLDAFETTLKRTGGSLDATGSQLTAEQRAHKTAFESFVRTGADANLAAVQKKSLSVGSDPDGGFLVPMSNSVQN